MNAQILSYAAVLQLLSLDIGVNSITGALPSSWANMTQASTVTTVYMPASIHFRHRAWQSSHKVVIISMSKRISNAVASVGLEQQPTDGDLASSLEQAH